MVSSLLFNAICLFKVRDGRHHFRKSLRSLSVITHRDLLVSPRSNRHGRLICMHLQCWEALPFLPFGASGVEPELDTRPGFYRKLALRPPQTFEKIRVSLRTIFSAVHTQIAVLVSTKAPVTKIWVSAPAPYKNPTVRLR